ncbi:hypothetical protein DFH07DRAFT_796965 [Mycena maculata]|uniref:Uncharacterized protein n=1 Tax=Mycena maculata TaxID=230809 RepID=A0AAD7NWK1_9AGAR|nr:hypothetical protein DFH07DRAFT_796965 [Mycena maculata]
MSVRYAATAYLRRTYALQLEIIDSYAHLNPDDIHCKEGSRTSMRGVHTEIRAAARPKCGNSASMNLYIDTSSLPNCLNHSQQPTIQQNSEEYLWGNVVMTYTESTVKERVVHELIEEVSRAGNKVEGEDRTRVSGRMVPAVKSPVRKFIPIGIQMENTP